MAHTSPLSHNSSISAARLLGLMSAALVLLSLLKYAFFPAYFTHEEPHYIEICWRLWQSKQWLILHDSQGLYLNKPPLLFWLVNALWHITGPRDLWFYVLPALATVSALYLQARAFATLWPAQHQWRAYSGLFLLLSVFFWQIYYLFNFDMIILACVAWALLALSRVFTGDKFAWLHFTAAVAVGLLTKGPVIILFTLLPALLAPVVPQLITHKRQYCARLGMAFLVSILLTMTWLYPLWQALGTETIISTVWHKGLGAANTYGSRPWYFYAYKFPLILMPLALLPITWRLLITAYKGKLDARARWCLLSVLSILAVFSLIPGKASRYIFPVMIYCCCLLTYLLAKLRAEQPGRQRQLHAMAGLLLLGQLSLGMYYYHFTQEHRAMAELADFLAQQPSATPIAYQRNYAGYHYSVDRKRIPKGPTIDNTEAWLAQHKKALVVVTTTQPDKNKALFMHKLNAEAYIVVIGQA